MAGLDNNLIISTGGRSVRVDEILPDSRVVQDMGVQMVYGHKASGVCEDCRRVPVVRVAVCHGLSPGSAAGRHGAAVEARDPLLVQGCLAAVLARAARPAEDRVLFAQGARQR